MSGISYPEVIISESGFMNEWKTPYLGFNEYFVNCEETPVWFIIVKSNDPNKNFETILSEFSKFIEHEEIRAYKRKLSTFKSRGLKANMFIMPEIFASNDCQVSYCHILKNEMLVVKGDCFYQCFTPKITENKFSAMIHWTCPTTTQQEIESLPKWKEKQTLLVPKMKIQPIWLLIDYVNQSLPFFSNEMLGCLLSMFNKRIEEETESKDLFLNKLKDSYYSSRSRNLIQDEWKFHSMNRNNFFNYDWTLVPWFEDTKDNRLFEVCSLCNNEIVIYFCQALDCNKNRYYNMWLQCAGDKLNTSETPDFMFIRFCTRFSQKVLKQFTDRIHNRLDGKKHSLETIKNNIVKLANEVKLESIGYEGAKQFYYLNQKFALFYLDDYKPVMYPNKPVFAEDLDLSDFTFTKSYEVEASSQNIQDTRSHVSIGDQEGSKDIMKSVRKQHNAEFIEENHQKIVKKDEENKESPKNTESNKKKRDIKKKRKKSEMNDFDPEAFKESMEIIREEASIEGNKNLLYYNPDWSFKISIDNLSAMKISSENIRSYKNFAADYKQLVSLLKQNKLHKLYRKIIKGIIKNIKSNLR